MNDHQTKREHSIDPKQSRDEPILHKGPWSKDEHALFLIGIERFSYKSWKKIAELVKTRDESQVRSHAQKFRNRQENDKRKIQNQRLSQRFMNSFNKTRSKIHLDDLQIKVETEDNHRAQSRLIAEKQHLKGKRSKRIGSNDKFENKEKMAKIQQKQKRESTIACPITNTGLIAEQGLFSQPKNKKNNVCSSDNFKISNCSAFKVFVSSPQKSNR